MSTDKTLADVQPGGRVRLGDQALRVFSAGRWTYDGTGQSFSHEEMDAAAFVVYRDAALSAKPSPGRQGEVTDDMVKAALGPNGWSTYNEEWSSRDRMRAALAAGLAARQPVRSSTVSDDMMDVVDRLGSEHDEVDPRAWDHMLIYAPTEKLAARLAARQPVVVDLPESLHDRVEALREVAARQPVGEPVAWYYGFSDTGEAGPVTFGGNPGAEAIAWAERHGHTLHYLYAAPPAKQPAQAVDLEQFREAVAEWRSNWANYGRTMTSAGRDTSKARRNVDEADRLLALIDSQAVGK